MFNIAKDNHLVLKKTCTILYVRQQLSLIFGLCGYLVYWVLCFFWYALIKQSLLESINPKNPQMMQQIAASSLNSHIGVVIRNS